MFLAHVVKRKGPMGTPNGPKFNKGEINDTKPTIL